MLVLLFHGHVFLDFQKLSPSKSMRITIFIDSEEFLDLSLDLGLVLFLSQRLLQLILDLVHVQSVRVVLVEQVERTVRALLQDRLALEQHLELVHAEVADEGRVGVHLVQARGFGTGHDGLGDRDAD